MPVVLAYDGFGYRGGSRIAMLCWRTRLVDHFEVATSQGVLQSAAGGRRPIAPVLSSRLIAMIAIIEFYMRFLQIVHRCSFQKEHPARIHYRANFGKSQCKMLQHGKRLQRKARHRISVPICLIPTRIRYQGIRRSNHKLFWQYRSPLLSPNVDRHYRSQEPTLLPFFQP